MSKLKLLRNTIISCVIIFFIIMIANAVTGWYGYEKWIYRRCTFGDKIKAIEKKVFVKDLQYESSIKLKDFHIYIEKGYRYGYISSRYTRPITNTKYPYQISLKINDTINNVNYNEINNGKFDSIGKSIYLKEPILKDTIWIRIKRYNEKWDSIGYIKVWDSSINSKDK